MDMYRPRCASCKPAALLCTLALVAALLSIASAGSTCGTTVTSGQVSISETSTSRVIKSTSCPGYDWTGQSTPNKATDVASTLTLPITPTIASSPFIYVGIYGANGVALTNAIKGPIGVSVNGVLIYGNANAENKDAYVNEAHTFDTCGGHADSFGCYHYHEETKSGCVFTDTTGKHSPLFAIMVDGVPMFGSLGDNGVAPTDLDECQGHTDSTYAFYHYHLPVNRAFPYTLACLKGCVKAGTAVGFGTVPSCTAASKQYDYSQVTALFKAGMPQVAATTPSTTSTSSTKSSPPPPQSTSASTTTQTSTSGSTTKTTTSTSTSTTRAPSPKASSSSASPPPPKSSTSSTSIKKSAAGHSALPMLLGAACLVVALALP